MSILVYIVQYQCSPLELTSEMMLNADIDGNGQLLEELNQKFAIVPIGNKFTIVNETETETMFLAPSDFRLALQNRFATDSTIIT